MAEFRIDLENRIALVTGAAGGIGLACAKMLKEAGGTIVMTDLRSETVSDAAAGIGVAAAFGCDISDQGAVGDLLRRVTDEVGPPDILVNCAGLISYRSSLSSITIEEWDQVLSVNLRAAFLLCDGVLPSMKEKGFGRIILISSLAAQVGGIEAGAHYSASKAGLMGLMKTVAKEAASRGVTVNMVAPGIIATGPVLQQVGDHIDTYRANIPLGRLGEPRDVAGAVLFLASSLADYITGATIDVNAGLRMG